jgi:hypothetical protein
MEQGCQIVYFHTKNPNLGKNGKYWYVYVMAISYKIRLFGIPILWLFGIFCAVWYFVPR